MASLYNANTGVLLGNLSESQLQFLIDHLEEEETADEDYYINQATVDLLQGQGAGPELIELLQKAIADTGDADVRWGR